MLRAECKENGEQEPSVTQFYSLQSRLKGNVVSLQTCFLSPVLLPGQERFTRQATPSGPSCRPLKSVKAPPQVLSCIFASLEINSSAFPSETFPVLREETCSQGILWSLLQSLVSPSLLFRVRNSQDLAVWGGVGEGE